jgi:predicted ATPase
MGLHVGEVQPRGGDFYGPAINRAARLMAAAHGGQVLLSAAAAGLVVDLLPDKVTLRDLGEHRLKDLARPEHVFQLLQPDLQADFPPLATLDHRPNNLPAQPTPLIGRETELAEILKRLSSDGVRLLTLTGPGGIGKTRLALQASAELIDRFADGVYFVDLASTRDADAVSGTIAQTLGLRGNSDRPLFDELKEQLRARQILLLLDNFEQVTAAASLVGELLRDCPQVKVLVTSREALHVRGEYVYPVPPLGLPKAGGKLPAIDQLTQYEAVRLFIERAQAVKPDFQVTNENAPAVAEICVRLDGLPLAIELAAARIRLFPPPALLERLGSRLSLLRGGARDLPVRQQTLRGAVDWSYELLDPGEQRLFELLSVFVGGCAVEVVEEVAGETGSLDETGLDILDGLASLVDKSLIRQVEPASGATRLLMLETIREYAAERLEADAAFRTAARRSHATYFASFTRQCWVRMAGPSREAAIAELGADLENMLTAWHYWVEEKDLGQLNQFVDALWLLNDVRGWYQSTVDLATDMLAVLAALNISDELLKLQDEIPALQDKISGLKEEVRTLQKENMTLKEGRGSVANIKDAKRLYDGFKT